MEKSKLIRRIGLGIGGGLAALTIMLAEVGTVKGFIETTLLLSQKNYSAPFPNIEYSDVAKDETLNLYKKVMLYFELPGANMAINTYNRLKEKQTAEKEK
jgi:hypothetical protein